MPDRIKDTINDLIERGDDIAWAVYHKGLVSEVTSTQPTDAQWADILENFNNETEGLWGALWESFIESVRQVMEADDE